MGVCVFQGRVNTQAAMNNVRKEAAIFNHVISPEDKEETGERSEQFQNGVSAVCVYFSVYGRARQTRLPGYRYSNKPIKAKHNYTTSQCCYGNMA